MYKIIVADDEEWIRKAIVKRVKDLSLDIEVVGEASDGQEAYQLALKTQPDIILTDIRMPYLNGIELIEKLKDTLSTTKIIIISGYAEFKYARSALQLGVFEYILKTVDDDILKDTLCQAIQQIEKDNTAANQLDVLKTKLIERTRNLQRNFIKELLTGKNFGEENIRRIIKNLELPLKIDHYYCVLVIELKECIDKDFHHSIKNINSFFSQKGYKCFILQDIPENKKLNVVLSSRMNNKLTKLYTYNLSKEVMALYNYSCAFIGISNNYKGCQYLNKAYIEAIDALKNKNLLKHNKCHCIHFQDIIVSKNFINHFTWEDEKKLTYYIEAGNYTEIENSILSIFQKINSNTQISTKILMKLYFDVILFLQNLLNKYQLSVEQVLEIDFLSLVNVPKTSSIVNLKDLLNSYTTKVSKYLISFKNDDPKVLLDTIKNYIENNYFESITLETITHKFFISKTYFSQLFKKEVGITFISFLTKIRMEHAVELLENNSLKVHEVAKMVGYSDPLYFGQVFKKHFGILPSDIRIINTLPNKTLSLPIRNV